MRRTALILSAIVSVSLLSPAIVPAQAAGSASIIQPDALTWAPAQGVPPGAQVAVLYGNPWKKGPFAACQVPFGLRLGDTFASDRRVSHGHFGQGADGIRQERRYHTHSTIAYRSFHDFARRSVASPLERRGGHHRVTLDWTIQHQAR